VREVHPQWPSAAFCSTNAAHVPMVRRPAHSGRRWHRDYLLAHLITCPILGNVVELQTWQTTEYCLLLMKN
jgi:hypothetical protein